MEIWKDIEWYEWKYQVSNLWNVKSLNYRKTWKEKLLKLNKDKDWYSVCSIYINWKVKILKCHRLVARAFIPNPESKKEVNHKNWIKDDNRIENLIWNTRSENMLHSYNILNNNSWFKKNRTISLKKYNWTPNIKKVNQYDLDWNFIKTWDCIMDIQRELSVFSSNIVNVCRWINKTSWWYIWKYA